jgi:hypothetical protein
MVATAATFPLIAKFRLASGAGINGQISHSFFLLLELARLAWASAWGNRSNGCPANVAPAVGQFTRQRR